MFEITKNHQDAYEYYINERMAYPGGDYDFTFEDRFLIYHAPLRHQTVYIAIDMKTGLSVEICSRKNGVYMEHELCCRALAIPSVKNRLNSASKCFWA